MGRARIQFRRLIASFLAGFLTTSSLWAESFVLPDLSGGLRDSVPAHMVLDNQVVDISNFHIDPESLGLLQRQGSRKQNTSQLSGNKFVDVFTYSQNDGDEFLIAFSSKTMAMSSDLGATWTTIITTATEGAVRDAVNFENRIYVVSQEEGGMSYDGSIQAVISSMPAGKFIETFQNRLWVANTAGNPNRLFFSGLLLPSSWTVLTDYFDFPEPITAIGPPYDGGLPIYTANTVWMLRGTSVTNFYLQQISGSIGCVDNRTVQNFILKGNEYQLFLSKGPNKSLKHVYALDGVRVLPVTPNAPNLISGISLFDTSSRQFDWDVASEFNAGTFEYTSSNILSESIVLSTISITETSFGDFQSNTSSTNTSISGLSNNISLTNTSTEIDDYDFDNLPFWDGVTFSTSGTGISQDGTFKKDNPYAAVMNDQTCTGNTYDFYFQLLNYNNFVVYSDTITIGVGCASGFPPVFGQRTFSNNFTGYNLKIRARTLNSNGATGSITSKEFLSSGGTFSYWIAPWTNGSKDFISFDYINGATKSSFTTAAYLSSSLDTGFPNGAYITGGSASATENGHNADFRIRTSTDNTNWTSLASWSTGTAPSVAVGRYVEYEVLFTTNAAGGGGFPSVEDVTIEARSSTGAFTSEVKDAGSAWSSWGKFNVNETLNGGTISYSYRVATTTTALAAASWTSISSGDTISGTGRYFQWKGDLSAGGASNNPTIERVTANYVTASGSAQPPDSVVWKEEYWLSYADSLDSETRNQSILVINRDGAISKFDGIGVYGFTAIGGILIGGDSQDDGSTGGYVWQLDTGTSDDGTPVTASVTLKHMALGWPDHEKTLNNVLFNYEVGSGSFSFDVLENFTEETTSYTIPFASGTVQNRWNQDIDQQTTAKTFGLRFTNSQSGQRLKLYPPIALEFIKNRTIQ